VSARGEFHNFVSFETPWRRIRVWREGSKAFDFWFTTRNLGGMKFGGSPHLGEFARAMPWCRSVHWREGSQAFDFLSATRYLEAISHEGEFARATPWCRSVHWREGRERSHEQRRGAAVLLTFGLTRAILKQARTHEGESAQATPWRRSVDWRKGSQAFDF